MKFCFTLIFVLGLFAVSAQIEPNTRASFPGGVDSLEAYLARTVVYPLKETDNQVYGKVVITVVVDTNGTFPEVQVVMPMVQCEACNQEAIRVVNRMPRWIPAYANGVPVKDEQRLEIAFSKWKKKPNSNTAISTSSNQAPPLTVSDGVDSNYVVRVAEVSAEFPGGFGAMKDYLETNIVLPALVMKGKIGGNCYTQFIVERDGSITNTKIVRGVTDCPECDAEALRVIQNMPKWKPAKMNGKIVRSSFNLPIAFKPD